MTRDIVADMGTMMSCVSFTDIVVFKNICVYLTFGGFHCKFLCLRCGMSLVHHHTLMVSWDIFVELNIGFQISFRLKSICCGDLVSAPGGNKCILELL